MESLQEAQVETCVSARVLMLGLSGSPTLGRRSSRLRSCGVDGHVSTETPAGDDSFVVNDAMVPRASLARLVAILDIVSRMFGNICLSPRSNPRCE